MYLVKSMTMVKKKKNYIINKILLQTNKNKYDNFFFFKLLLKIVQHLLELVDVEFQELFGLFFFSH